MQMQMTSRQQKEGKKGRERVVEKGKKRVVLGHVRATFFSLFNFFLRHVRVATKVHIFSGISPQANFSKCWLK